MNKKGKHLTNDERLEIEKYISMGKKKIEISVLLNKDRSTIGKEIKLHRKLSTYNVYKRQCALIKTCQHRSECYKECTDFVEFFCYRRDISPGACNGCDAYRSCRYNKYFYRASEASHEYRTTLTQTRIGFNLTTLEIKSIAELIGPLLKKGHSPYVIITNHPELNISEKTLYTYIESGIFKDYGIDSFSLRRKVSRKLPKKVKTALKKRKDNSYIINRKYEDFKTFLENTNETNIIQMDTVYNDGSNGPFIQTFKFLRFGFMFAVFHREKLSLNMVNGIILLESILGQDLFEKYVKVILTDRGSEFSAADAMETRGDGSKRTNLFYCDPMQSCQKGSLENYHEELRYILPKETNLYELGLKSQNDLNTVLSHINSSPKEKLDGKTPIELLEFLAPLLAKKFRDFGIIKIDKDDVILKPHLLKQ